MSVWARETVIMKKKQWKKQNGAGLSVFFYPDGFDTYVMEFKGRWRNWQISVLSAVVVSDSRWKRRGSLSFLLWLRGDQMEDHAFIIIH